MDYQDMIHLPHHQSKTRKRMSISDRAAQFAPFSALTGHEAAIRETGRLTDSFLENDEYEQELLNRKLVFLKEHQKEHPMIKVTRFLPDEKKEGGKYQTLEGYLKKISEYEKKLVLQSGEEIFLEQITELESPCLKEFF